MNFKEYLQEDIENIFFQEEEFAEIHNIDGVDMSVIIDEDELEKFKERQKGDYEGIYKESLLFFVKKSEFGEKPAVDSLMDFDGRTYMVISSSDENGIIKVVLGWNRD